MKLTLDKLLIASGFIGPAVFFLTIYLVFPFLYSGYDFANRYISELGGSFSPIKTLANVFGFSLCGIFIMLFAFGLFRSKEINRAGRLSAFFIFLTGILMYLTGIFHMSSEGGLYSLLDTLHAAVANYQFPVLALGLVLFAFSIAGHKKLYWLTPVILVFGIITLILAYFNFFVHELHNPGVWQRAAIGLPYLLVMVIAAALYRVQFAK